MDAGLHHLIRLQQIDHRLSQLRESIALLPAHLNKLEDKLDAQKHTHHRITKEVIAEESRRRRLDSELKDYQQKLIKYREQSNDVKNNEQFHALQHEIAFVDEEIRKIEEATIASLERTETLEKQFVEAENALAAQSVLVDAEKARAEAEAAEHEAQMEVLLAERQQHRAGIEPAILTNYDRISSSSRKTGLARVQGQRCLACQMYLRPHVWNQVRSGVLLTCESCGRLQYYDAALEPPPVPLAVPVKKARKRRSPAVEQELVQSAGSSAE
jgi:predicted  nucleic acid-binding Zn-ribbon protein